MLMVLSSSATDRLFDDLWQCFCVCCSFMCQHKNVMNVSILLLPAFVFLDVLFSQPPTDPAPP